MAEFDIQNIRKTNLKLVIDEYAKGSVDIFSKIIDKNRTYVYALLKNMDENNPRAITSKTARFIEEYFGLPTLSLDDPNYRKELKRIGIKSIDEYILEFQPNNDQVILKNQNVERENFSNKILSKLSLITDQTIYYYEINNELMTPTFDKGDLVFITNLQQISYSDINNGDIYLIHYSKQIYLVRIYTEFGEKIKCKVDNPFKQHVFSEIIMQWVDFQQSIQVMGKAVGKLSLKKDFI